MFYFYSFDFDRTATPESVVSEFSLVCGNDYQRSLSSSVYMGSKMAGSIVFGLLSDRFGRVRITMVAAICVTIFGVATSFAPNMLAFIILRGCIAFAATGLYLCG